MLSTALLAFALVTQGDSINESQTVQLGGQDVPLTFQLGPTQASLPNTVFAWDGWSYLRNTEREPNLLFAVDGDWADIQNAYESVTGAINEKTPLWRTKVILFVRSDVLDYGIDGIVRQRRASMTPSQITKALEAVRRFAALVETSADGNIKVDLQIDIENEPVRWNAEQGAEGRELEYFESYLKPRINGGGYEPEDKLYRGPYQSVFCIHTTLGAPEYSFDMNGSPIGVVSIAGESQPGTDSALSVQLYNLWRSHLEFVLHDKGYQAPNVLRSSIPAARTYYPGPGALRKMPVQLTPEEWAKVTQTEPVDSVEYVRNHQQKLTTAEDEFSNKNLIEAAERTVNTEVQLVQDTERGNVLRYFEKGFFRAGGAAAPKRADGEPIADLAEKPYVSFFAKSSGKEPVAVVLHGEQAPLGMIILGAYDVWPVMRLADSNLPKTFLTSFESDGQWHRIIVDASAFLKSSDAKIYGLSIETPHASAYYERKQIDPVEVFFDDFDFLESLNAQATVDPGLTITANADSPRVAFRVLAAATTDDQSALIKLLEDSSDTVRLNAILRFQSIQNAEAIPALIANTPNLNPQVAAAAVAALAHQDTPEAWLAIRSVLRSGPSNMAREVAAESLATLEDPKLAIHFSTLIASRSWQTRQAGAIAVSKLPEDTSQIALMTFLQENDPAVRLAVTKRANATKDFVCRRLMWSAVNDPSDMVRAWSYVRLIDSGIAEYVAEGYKGVRDDGYVVRQMIIDQLIQDSKEAHRGAAQLAVVDIDPRVRAKALKLFAVLPNEVELKEISNVLMDDDPRVQMALVNLTLAKSLRLPKETIDNLLESIDQQVVMNARRLPQ